MNMDVYFSPASTVGESEITGRMDHIYSRKVYTDERVFPKLFTKLERDALDWQANKLVDEYFKTNSSGNHRDPDGSLNLAAIRRTIKRIGDDLLADVRDNLEERNAIVDRFKAQPGYHYISHHYEPKEQIVL